MGKKQKPYVTERDRTTRLLVYALTAACAIGSTAHAADVRQWRVRQGTATLQLRASAIAGAGVALRSSSESSSPWSIVHPVTPGSALTVDVTGGNAALVSADLDVTEGFILSGNLRSVETRDMRIQMPLGSYAQQLTISGTTTDQQFRFGASGLIALDVDVRLDYQAGLVVLTSEWVTLSSSWAKALGVEDYLEAPLAELVIELSVESLDPAAPAFPPAYAPADYTDTMGGVAAVVIGPDVTVTALSGTTSYGSENVSLNGDPARWVSAFSLGAISCNIGDENLSWVFDNSNQHPVISQNLYRLKQSRFEQIGLSWLKHGFFATDGNQCGTCSDTDGSVPGTVALAPGCSDLYSSSLNGNWRYLGPRSEVNAHTGFFPGPPPYGTRDPSDIIGRRLQVDNDDLRPASNIGAEYFTEVQYITPDDAAAENDNNNASYKPINVLHLGGEEFALADALGPTMTERAAIYAWAAADPTVVITEAQVPGEGLFILGAKATDLNNGFFHYEYAVFNMNSDRSGGSFSVPLPDGASILNIGFHDVFYHSGELIDGTDWTATLAPGSITWATTPFATDENANALRWGTLYNFRFDASVVPQESTVTLGLFKPGTPESVGIVTVGPAIGLVDCNGNGISDLCDVDCTRLGCSLPNCETSIDCNGNGIPDECEPDCNTNHIPDTCDLDWETGATCVGCQGVTGTAVDCDGNLIPDVCDPDCNGNGTPDACEAVLDTDGDNVEDCDDLCPFSTPPGLCDCLPTCCCDNGICFGGLPPETCLAMPGCFLQCQVPKCRLGCLLGDSDDDGDVDLRDTARMLSCFSGNSADPLFVSPGADCLRWFDFDEDGDVDGDDYYQNIVGERYLFFDAFSGP